MMVWTGPSVRPAEPDPELAEMFRKYNVEPDRSDIIQTDVIMTAFNREKLGRKRFVDLSCGHKAITTNAKRMMCPRCVEMLRQGQDYEGWINNREHVYDGMLWPDDPCRIFNEPTNMAGELYNSVP